MPSKDKAPIVLRQHSTARFVELCMTKSIALSPMPRWFLRRKAPIIRARPTRMRVGNLSLMLLH